MPTTIPGPLPGWAATLVNLTSTAPHSFLFDLLTYFNEVPDANNLEWRHLAIHCDNLASSDTADDAVIGFDIANITGGALDVTWTTADYTTCETAFTTFLTALLGQMQTQAKFDKMSWYRRRFNPYTESKPFQDGGPPQRVTTLNLTGTAVSAGAPQVSATITERTAWPKHWGRVYLPFIATNTISTNMQFTSAATSAWATAYQTLMNSLVSSEFYLVVPTTQVDKVPNRGLLQITSVQVDSLPDVVRRRRFRTPATRTIKP